MSAVSFLKKTKGLVSAVESLARSWSCFWFESADLKRLGLLRLLILSLLFVLYAVRFYDFEVFYSEKGMLPSSLAFEFVPEASRSQLSFYFNQDLALWYQHLAFLLLLALGALGFFSYIALPLALVIHLGFLERNYAIVYGADLVATCWLLYLSFSFSDQYYSLRSLSWWQRLFKDRPVVLSQWQNDLSSMSFRLIQIQLCVLYAVTGFEKFKGYQWWEGSAIWYVFGNLQLVDWNLAFFKDAPLLIALMTHATLLFEIYFPVMVWLRPLVRPWLILGILMHMVSGLVMGLYFFAGLMILPYLLFWPRTSGTPRRSI